MLQGVRWFDPCWCMADANEAQSCCEAQDMLVRACEWTGRGPSP
jgi:hypothetical protein